MSGDTLEHWREWAALYDPNPEEPPRTDNERRFRVNLWIERAQARATEQEQRADAILERKRIAEEQWTREHTRAKRLADWIAERHVNFLKHRNEDGAIRYTNWCDLCDAEWGEHDVPAHTTECPLYTTPEPPRSGLAAIMGQWPGNETDQEILEALSELDGKERNDDE